MEGGNRPTVLREITLSTSVEFTSTPTRKCALPYHTTQLLLVGRRFCGTSEVFSYHDFKTTSVRLWIRLLVKCKEPSSRSIRQRYFVTDFILTAALVIILKLTTFLASDDRNKATVLVSIDATALTLRNSFI